MIPEMHLGQPKFTYSACGSFTKNKERIKCLKKLDKTCFQHDIAYKYFKDLTIRTGSDKKIAQLSS